MALSVLNVAGAPYELGLQHGQQARQKVHRNVQFYMRLWESFGGMTRDEILKQVEGFVPYIESYDAQLVEELQGLAKGSGLSFEEVVALNARTELTFACLSPGAAAPEACSSYALMPEVTNDGHMIMGQNWDWRAEADDCCIVLRIDQKDKPSIVMHTEAGCIGHRGFNSAGIGICMNFIRCDRDTFRHGLPYLIKMRAVLNSTSLPDCLKMLAAYVGPNSMNMLLGHGDGEALDIEHLPDDLLFLHPRDGILTHTNHFLSPRFRDKDMGKYALPDTMIRADRMTRLLTDRRGRLAWDTLKEVLKDHFGYPDSICRHRDQRTPANQQWETLCSMIMDLTAGEMLYAPGPPCSHPYRRIRL